MIELINESVFIKNEVNSAKMKLTAAEVDLFVLLATKIRGNDYAQITVTYEELAFLYGENRVYYKALSPIFEGLLKNIIEVYDVQTKKYTKCVLVTRVDFFKNSGFAVFSIDPFVAKLLEYVRDHSTIFQLRTVLALKSVHAKRIYMMASQFKKSGVWSIEIDDLKARLGLIDKKSGAELYSRYTNFKARVLENAIKEINEIAEFKIELQPTKQGREVTRLTFIIYIKSIKDEVKLTEVMKMQIARLRKGGVSDWQIENILYDASEALINKILYAYDTNKANITNPGGWLTSAFEKQGIEMRKKRVDTEQLDLVDEINKQNSAA